MKLLVSALEHSANLHLSSIKEHLGDDVELCGIFDRRLGESIVDLSALSIMGFVDAAKKLPFFFRLKDQMLDLAEGCDKVLLIDSSGFNLPLAKALKKRYPHKPIIYYILPQAWAWKKKRIPVLERTIDRLCSILPFEPAYYGKNAPIEYVGHPLLDQIQKRKEGVTCKGIVTFMPGSRRGEITRLMPYFQALRPQLQEKALLVIPRTFSQAQIKELYGDISGFSVTHDAHDALYESDFAFICSGTATLEAALIGTPFVLAYRAKKLDYLIAKTLVKLRYVGLGNIMFDQMQGRALHRELLQDDVSTHKLMQAYRECDREAFYRDTQALRGYLQNGASARMAHIILNKEH
ncbi:MAG: lipid-A-disaccharide synthase [Campylobacterales bacterium]|nr:lipid-A-disaccharide synthase [Campylobacterales bacterium]